MIALSLNERLKETNPRLSRLDDLAPGECNSALDRVGAALVLGRLDSILVPDGGVDLARSDDSLDLADILDGWSGAGRTRLISRAAFDPARAGTVRLHNDNEGSASHRHVNATQVPAPISKCGACHECGNPLFRNVLHRKTLRSVPPTYHSTTELRHAGPTSQHRS